MENTDRIAVCENRDSERVIKFIPESDFTPSFLRDKNNNSVWGVYYNESGDIVAEDIWEEVYTDILN